MESLVEQYIAKRFMEENEILIFKKKLVDDKNKQHCKIFSEFLKSAEEYFEIDYKGEGVFKKKYLICGADFGKKCFGKNEIFVIFVFN
ncbi:MAG: hypothetical protein EVA26_06565 [Burkholderiaceae bacterium]|nr:MAG: hypothetical protein EVA26_06565 [Burkholderiaceae bacterium]